jgi:RES domain-containing protein
LNVLWRISNHANLEGLSGERTNGRWHTAEEGKRIVYLAEHPALALIEILVNLRGKPEQFPASFQLLKISVGEHVSSGTVVSNILAEGWREDLAETQSVGDRWLREKDSALLAVPSAPSPESTNYLMNPLHPDAKQVSIEWQHWLVYDRRLFRTHF